MVADDQHAGPLIPQIRCGQPSSQRKRFATFVVCRRYWRNNLDTVKALGTSLGGEFVGGTHFTFAGGQIGSLLSFVSYMGSGENRPRYLGMKIPLTNLKPDYLEGALAFANRLADLVLHSSPAN
jgi:hypothetical protein